jgi:hypothetical protein
MTLKNSHPKLNNSKLIEPTNPTMIIKTVMQNSAIQSSLNQPTQQTDRQTDRHSFHGPPQSVGSSSKHKVQQEGKPYTLVLPGKQQCTAIAGRRTKTLYPRQAFPKTQRETDKLIAFHKFQWRKKLLIKIAYAICCIRINPVEMFPKQTISQKKCLVKKKT